ncbi:MAG TPA: hypothetical protein VFS00_00160 [Polyangiaceae bacterium]|nr:hypothetical protein [Polyangiaceae bacterium]
MPRDQHLSFRALAAAPVAWVAAFLLGFTVMPGAFAPTFVRFEIEAAKAAAFVGCLAAARAFSPGDYLHRAWLLHASCYALLLARDLVLITVVRDQMAFGVPFAYVQALLVTGANVCLLVGSFMLARAWRVAGLELPGRPAWRAAATALWVAAAAAIIGQALLIDARKLAEGHVGSVVGLSSDVSDLLSMCLVAPVFFTALALRGGVLRWPWALLTVGFLCWLFYDAGLVLTHALALTDLPARVFRESFRGAACLYVGAAGLAQALALREVAPPPSSRPPVVSPGAALRQ